MENKKIYFEIYNDKKQITRTETDTAIATAELLSCLYNKYIVKMKYIKQVQYSYNYTDRQKITFIFNNNYRQVFCNIPTKLASLDTMEMIRNIK